MCSKVISHWMCGNVGAIGAIGALMNRVLQPHPLIVLGLNVWMGTAAGADELVERLLDEGVLFIVGSFSVDVHTLGVNLCDLLVTMKGCPALPGTGLYPRHTS